MNPSNTVTFKDAALGAVGRTVVNFQRLEHNLKIAARLGPLEGILAKVQRDFERRIEKTSTMTLGQSIEAWLSVIKGGGPRTNPTPDLFDPTIRQTFSLGEDINMAILTVSTMRPVLEPCKNTDQP